MRPGTWPARACAASGELIPRERWKLLWGFLWVIRTQPTGVRSSPWRVLSPTGATIPVFTSTRRASEFTRQPSKFVFTNVA